MKNLKWLIWPLSEAGNMPHHLEKQILHIVVVMKKPPMCQIMRLSIYYMNRSTEGTRVN